MEDIGDLVLGEHARDQAVVADVAGDGVHARRDALHLQAGQRRPVSPDHDDVGPALQQLPAQVRPDQPVGTGDERGAPAHRLRAHPGTPATGAVSHGAPLGSAS
jgi:hypothetical protein